MSKENSIFKTMNVLNSKPKKKRGKESKKKIETKMYSIARKKGVNLEELEQTSTIKHPQRNSIQEIINECPGEVRKFINNSQAEKLLANADGLFITFTNGYSMSIQNLASKVIGKFNKQRTLRPKRCKVFDPNKKVLIDSTI